jgi:hypothetical protein
MTLDPRVGGRGRFSINWQDGQIFESLQGHGAGSVLLILGDS